MSTTDVVASLLANGRLTPYRPQSRKRPRRCLYLTDTAVRDLTGSSAVNLLVGRAKLEAAMARWVLGEPVYARFLWRLEQPPPEIWEIRVTEPTPQARIICRFIEPDSLIVTEMRTRGLLRGKDSAEWANVMTRCANTWSELFPDHEPFSAQSIHEYVTENCDEFELAT